MLSVFSYGVAGVVCDSVVFSGSVSSMHTTHIPQGHRRGVEHLAVAVCVAVATLATCTASDVNTSHTPTRRHSIAHTTLCPDGPRGLPWRWPGWGTVATSTWGSNSSCCTTTPRDLRCCSGLDSPEEARFKVSVVVVVVMLW